MTTNTVVAVGDGLSSNAVLSTAAGNQALIGAAFDTCEAVDGMRAQMCQVTRHRDWEGPAAAGSCRPHLELECAGTSRNDETAARCRQIAVAVLHHSVDPKLCQYSISTAWNALYDCSGVSLYPSGSDLLAITSSCAHNHESICAVGGTAKMEAVYATIAPSGTNRILRAPYLNIPGMTGATKWDQSSYEFGPPPLFGTDLQTLYSEPASGCASSPHAPVCDTPALRSKAKNLEFGTLSMAGIFANTDAYWQPNVYDQPYYSASGWLGALADGPPAHKGAMTVQTSLCQAEERVRVRQHCSVRRTIVFCTRAPFRAQPPARTLLIRLPD
jgi:hypothetical protein